MVSLPVALRRHRHNSKVLFLLLYQILLWEVQPVNLYISEEVMACVVEEKVFAFSEVAELG